MNNEEVIIQQRKLRKPLHEPKYRNVLPITKKRKSPSKWPKITIPPLNCMPLKLPARENIIENEKVAIIQRLTNPIKLEQRPPRGKHWNKIKLMHPLNIKILRGTQSLSSKKFNLLSNRKQSCATAIVALAYSKIYSIINWDCLDLDRIIDISDVIYRKSLSLTSKANIIAPTTTLTLYNICNNFYIDNFNVTTVLDYPIDYFEDKIKVSNNLSIDQFTNNLNTFIENHENCILHFNKMYFTIWLYQKERKTTTTTSDEKFYYCFNPFNCNENGQQLIRNNSKGYCCLIKMQTIDEVVQYLLRAIFYQNEINNYRLETIRILKIVEKLKYPTIDETIIINDIAIDENGYHKECFDENVSYKIPTVINLQSDLNVENMYIERKDFNNINQEIICEIDDTEQGRDDDDDDDNEDDKELRNVILTQQFPKHHIDFSDDYLNISNVSGILRGGSYVKQANTIPCVNIAAIVMLRIARSFTWTKDTIHEIQSIGKKVYKNNLSNVDDNIILSNDITAPIKIGNSKFNIVSEQILFGTLSNALQNLNNIANLEYGVQEFFKLYDIGILDGPENVAIWQENNLYYMFNGRKCDKYGKKWSNIISDRDINNVDDEFDDELTYGAACVTWYHNLKDMVNCYMNNISIKHSQESYRLTYIEVNDAIKKSDNWQNWLSFGLMKWILRGHFSQNNIKYSIDSRNNQSTTISIIALVYTKLVRIEEWESNSLDEILDIGDCFYLDCVKKLKDSEKFNQSHLQINEIMNYYTVKNKCIEFIINDSLVTGSFLSPSSLEEGFCNFFQYNDQGVLTSDHFSLAFWKKSDYFYLFDSYERDDKGKNPLTCPSIYRQNNFENTCCALRFGALTDFVDNIIGNVKVYDSTAETFKLNNLEIIITDQNVRPPLYDYLEFGENNGILYGNNEFNKELIYKLSNQKQQNIICNLIVALCMKQIKKSKKWTKYDLNDIVKIGFEHYCVVLKKFQDHKNLNNQQNEILAPCIENDIFLKYQLDYFLIDKYSVKIGANQFQIIANEIHQGKFTIKENSISSKIFDRKSSIIILDDTTKQSSHQTINSGKSSILERLSMRRSINNSEGSNNASRRVNQSFSNLVNTDKSQQDQNQQKLCFNLKQILEKLKTKDNFNCILESDIITIGIWKQDNLYFVYDPLLCNLECTQLHPKRITQYREKIINKIINNNKNSQLKQQETIGDGILTSNIAINGNKELTNIIESPENNVSDKNNTSVIVATADDNDDDHEAEIILDENYSPYIAWFSSVNDLIEHIFQFVPKKFENEWFKLYEFEYENKLDCIVDDDNFENNNNIDNQMKLYNFKKVNKNYCILRGSMSQNDNIFLKIPNRNNQDLSNDIIALVLSTLCTESNDWNSKILDIILKYGDRLYTASILKHQQQQQQQNHNNANAQIINYNLQLNDIIKPFTLANIIIDFKLNTTINGNLTKATKNTENALEEFFNGAAAKEKQEHLGILMAKNYAVAIWFTQKTYFMFDSHEIGPNGLHRKNGVSCLYRFSKIQHLNDIFLKNLDYNITGTNQFELFHITITKSLKPSNVPKNYLQLPITHSAYKNITHQYIKSPYMIDVNVLYGNISYDQNSSTTCQTYAALIINHTNNVDYWTMDTIDQIFRLGKEIYKKSIKFINDDDDDDDCRNLSPQQITKDFQLNENLIIHSEIQMIYAGIINSYPNQIYHQYDNSDNNSKILTLKNGIGKFFQKYSYGILCINDIELIIGLWKENYGYYLFFAKWLNVELLNQLVEMQNKLNDYACVIKFSDQSQLYDEIILNINKLRSSAINDELENPLFYEIWNCDCTIVDNSVTRNNKIKKLFKDIIIPELRIPASAPKHTNVNYHVQDNTLKIIFEAQQRKHLHSNSNNMNT